MALVDHDPGNYWHVKSMSSVNNSQEYDLYMCGEVEPSMLVVATRGIHFAISTKTGQTEVFGPDERMKAFTYAEEEAGLITPS